MPRRCPGRGSPPTRCGPGCAPRSERCGTPLSWRTTPAVALVRHADEVDRTKALIAAIERKVTALVAAAKDRLAGLVASVLPDPVDEFLDRFVPPPPGHRDWLTVDLPGVS